MARNVAFYVSTTNNTVKVVDTDAQGTIVGGATTGFGEWSADMTLLDLTNAQATLKMRNVFGHTVGVFTYAELGAVTIDGADQSGSISNLGEFEEIFAQYLYQDDLGATITSSLSSSAVIINTSNTVVGSGDGDKLNALGATAITVQFSITGTTALATNTVKLYATIDQTTWYQIGSNYSGVGDVTGLLLNYTLISDTTIPLQVKLVVVDGGAGTMTTQAVILGIRA